MVSERFKWKRIRFSRCNKSPGHMCVLGPLSPQWSHLKTCRNTGISGFVPCRITSARASSSCEYLSVIGCVSVCSRACISWSVCVSGMKTVRWETPTSTRKSPRYRRRSCVWSAHRFTPVEGITCRHAQRPQSGGEHREEHLSLASSLTSPLVHLCFFSSSVWLSEGHEMKDAGASGHVLFSQWLLSISHLSGGADDVTGLLFRFVNMYMMFVSLDSKWWISVVFVTWLMTWIDISELCSEVNFLSSVLQSLTNARSDLRHIITHVYASVFFMMWMSERH